MPRRGETKAALLRALQQCEGQSLSGQQLAETLGISRAAVHKAATGLQKLGYAIDASSGRGYKLLNGGDAFTQTAFAAALSPNSPIAQYTVLEETESTNFTARRLAQDGAPHSTVVTAACQKKGRGRLGRSFVSPQGGVYLSVILRPELSAADALPATGCAAVAVCRAVRRLCGIELKIKWVNDLFYKGKKICGILTEAVTDFESGRVEHLVVGIGLNFETDENDFPPELRSIAGSLYTPGTAPCSRVRMAAAIAEELLAPDLRSTYLEEYRALSMVNGHYLTVTGDGEPYTAYAEGIADDGSLCIRLSGGGSKQLRFGEVSIRPAPGSF